MEDMGNYGYTLFRTIPVRWGGYRHKSMVFPYNMKPGVSLFNELMPGFKV